MELRENKDFNVEEKGSELVEQRRLQLKRRKHVEREIRRGELWRQRTESDKAIGRVKDFKIVELKP